MLRMACGLQDLMRGGDGEEEARGRIQEFLDEFYQVTICGMKASSQVVVVKPYARADRGVWVRRGRPLSLSSLEACRERGVCGV